METRDDPGLTKRKIGEEVLDQLLLLIETGKFSPGDRLPSERALMASFGVGRPAIREALQSLQQMGRIAISHGERARVVTLTPATMFEQIGRSARHMLSISPQTLEDLKEARLLFETAMVRLAVPKATNEDLARLRATIDALAAVRDGGRGFLEADMAFHKTIAAISGNPIFAAVSAAMLGWLADFHTELVRAYGKEDLTVAEHLEVYGRMAARDVEGAVHAMSRHLTRANGLYRTTKPGAPRGAN
jgi:DNA-binding FadR family transcriptional regulator